MRGTRRQRGPCGPVAGIIPAYAGNTSSASSRSFSNRDHPRVCGEHPDDVGFARGPLGSSPRMRGTPGRCRLRARSTGIIPAYAGNTSFFQRPSSKRRDHPRVCGEHLKMHRPEAAVWGSSPRMRGTHVSPFLEFRFAGIIPAYAGNTKQTTATGKPCRDHPRVCGEHRGVQWFERFQQGSSPRMRGTRGWKVGAIESLGIIPAYAGNTSLLPSRLGSARDHPRVCGEHMTIEDYEDCDSGSSPRMRGTPVVGEWLGGWKGIIPAYAGNTILLLPLRVFRWDHPRVCGEHGTSTPSHACRLGSSPRMRGTLGLIHGSVRDAGIIPAYAGNTLRDYSNFVVSKFMSFVFHLV